MDYYTKLYVTLPRLLAYNHYPGAGIQKKLKSQQDLKHCIINSFGGVGGGGTHSESCQLDLPPALFPAHYSPQWQAPAQKE